MDKISINIARKIQQLIQGEVIPFGQLKSKVVNQMIDEGILNVKVQGRTRKSVFAIKPQAISNYLSSNHGINDLGFYINNLETGISRAENIIASSNSKSSARRTFKGFLVNCVTPIEARINEKNIIINPQEGTYTYIHDFNVFTISLKTIVIGVENPENFRFIDKQLYLFGAESILFVCRYPQSKDLINWLQVIPNKYIHFGDFDFEGIRIFRDEYYQFLDSKASYFIPENIEELLNKYGNKDLYDIQYKSNSSLKINYEIEQLLELFHKYKKCLEQEVLISI